MKVVIDGDVRYARVISLLLGNNWLIPAWRWRSFYQGYNAESVWPSPLWSSSFLLILWVPLLSPYGPILPSLFLPCAISLYPALPSLSKKSLLSQTTVCYRKTNYKFTESAESRRRKPNVSCRQTTKRSVVWLASRGRCIFQISLIRKREFEFLSCVSILYEG